MARSALVMVLAALSLPGQACTAIAVELRTAQRLYKDARYEEAQTWLSELDVERTAMSPTELAHFYYLRGMTAFRLSQREDALHYLALAYVVAADDVDRLPQSWRQVMERTLLEIVPRSASPHARNPLRPDAI